MLLSEPPIARFDREQQRGTACHLVRRLDRKRTIRPLQALGGSTGPVIVQREKRQRLEILRGELDGPFVRDARARAVEQVLAGAAEKEL